MKKTLQEKLFKLIENYGIERTSDIVGIDIFKILEITDIEIHPNINIEYSSLLNSINNQRKLEFHYKGFNINYDDISHVITWDGTLKIEYKGENYNINLFLYATPFFDANNTIPIHIDFYEILDLFHHVIASDDTSIFVNVKCPDVFNNIFDFQSWLYNDYPETVFNKIDTIVNRYKDDLFEIIKDDDQDLF